MVDPMSAADDVDRMELRALLAHLDARVPQSASSWGGWRVRPVSGGANNRLYRASGAGLDLAIKFTIDDPRGRARREYLALQALERLELAIAPRALLLDRFSPTCSDCSSRW